LSRQNISPDAAIELHQLAIDSQRGPLTDASYFSFQLLRAVLARTPWDSCVYRHVNSRFFGFPVKLLRVIPNPLARHIATPATREDLNGDFFTVRVWPNIIG